MKQELKGRLPPPQKPVCDDCANDMGEYCSHRIETYPFSYTCQSYNSGNGNVIVLPPPPRSPLPRIKSAVQVEFKVFSESNPDKMIKYAYLPEFE